MSDEMNEDSKASIEDVKQPPDKQPAIDPTAMGLMAAALAKAQLRFSNPKKTIEVEVKTKKGYTYKFKYADLAAVLDVIRKPLAENGIALVQKIKQSDGKFYIQTILMHLGGGFITTDPIEVGNVAQDVKDVGGLVTYWRRYCLSALVGIASEEDGVENNGVGAGSGDPIRGGNAQKSNDNKQQAQPAQPAQPGWKYQYKYGVLKRLKDGKWQEYDASAFNAESLNKALEHAQKRATYYATESNKKGPLLDAQHDIQIIKQLLKNIEASEQSADGNKKAETEKPAEDDQAAPEQAESGDTAPEENVEQEPEPESKPQSTPDMLPIVKDAAHLKMDYTPGTVKAIDDSEVEMLDELVVAEFTGMVAHPENAELFDPEMGELFIKNNPNNIVGANFVEWLITVWLPTHEADSKRARLARRLLRVAIICHSLTDRLTGETTPEPQLRETTPDEYHRLKDFAMVSIPPVKTVEPGKKKEGKYDL